MSSIPSFPSFPSIRPMPRQINTDYWINGQHFLEENPQETRIRVHHHIAPNMVWEYFVVRTKTGYENQIWCNGVLVDTA